MNPDTWTVASKAHLNLIDVTINDRSINLLEKFPPGNPNPLDLHVIRSSSGRNFSGKPFRPAALLEWSCSLVEASLFLTVSTHPPHNQAGFTDTVNKASPDRPVPSPAGFARPSRPG